MLIAFYTPFFLQPLRFGATENLTTHAALQDLKQAIFESRY